MNEMKKGTKVSWGLRDGSSGTGTVITDAVDGKVQVAVETLSNRGNTSTDTPEMHCIIWCNVTWLAAVG